MADNRLFEPAEVWLRRVAPGWRDTVEAFAASATGMRLLAHLADRQRDGATIFPADPLRALALTDRAAVRVVILGQDPYHGAGQAEGLAFSVPDGCPPPPSLRNVLAELKGSTGVARSGVSLLGWADQGVLLLNTVLTVEAGRPASHARLGWEVLTDSVIRLLIDSDRPIVFLLWGAQAGAKQALFDPAARSRHAVLTANHPSPLSARRPPVPFLGCGHFAQARDFLARVEPERPPPDWAR